MKVLFVFLVAFGVLIASFALLKISDGWSQTEPAAFSAVLNKGQAVSASFVPAQSGAYQAPCSVVCSDGKTGTLLFSSMR